MLYSVMHDYFICVGINGHNHELDGTRYGERCSCCPYGYHIDLDFLRYLDTLYSGESLKSLRRIRHGRGGGLSVSTGDGFFSDDELSRWRLSPVSSPPPRSASSSSRVTTDEILMEIDSSMSHTLHGIDHDVDSRVVRKKKPPRPLPEGRSKENGYRSAPEERRIQQLQELKARSQPAQESKPRIQQDSKMYSEVTSTTVTSTEIADKFTGLMSGAESPIVGDQPPEHATSAISPEILQAIREQMAVSLQRMRELEDQVRVVPLMEDQISTLRAENKRLYHLLSRLTENERARSVPVMNGDAGLQVEGDENVRTFRGEQGSILVELPVKIGSNEISDRSSYSMRSTETRTQVQETKASSRREFFWGTPNADDTAGLSPERLRLFKPTRTIGVGDGDVFETGGSIDWPAWRKTRDVGVHCLPPSRDVSVSVSEMPGEERQEEDEGMGGAKVSLTVTVSDERRACEPRWEVERFGTGLYQSVAIQCLIIGGFLSSDRPHMSENVDGWLVDTNKLWTYSATDDLPQSLSAHTRLESEKQQHKLPDYMSPEDRFESEKQHSTLADYTSSLEDRFVKEQSMSEVTIERQSASLNALLEKLSQSKMETLIDDAVREEKAVLARANQPAFDVNASFEKLQVTSDARDDTVKEDIIVRQSKPKVSTLCTDRAASEASFDINASYKRLQETADAQDHVVKEDFIVPESKPKPSSSSVDKAAASSLAFDINASLKKLQEIAEADQVVKEDVIVPQSKPKASSSCTDSSSTFDFSAGFAKLQEVKEETVEEEMIIRQSAATKASSHHVEKLSLDDIVSKQASSLESRLIVETKETVVVNKEAETSVLYDGIESGDESTGRQPFPPHLSRITASSISDDDALGDQQQQQHDVTVLETTVVEATSSSEPGSVAVQRHEVSILPDQTSTTQSSAVSEGGTVVTHTVVTREVTEVISGSEVTTEVTSSSVERVSTSSVPEVSAETTEPSSYDSVDTSHTTGAVIATEVGEVQQSSGEVGSVSVSEAVLEVSDVSKSENIPVSSQETVSSTQHSESTVVTAEVGGVQQSGAVVPAAEVGDVTADTAADQSQGCHVIITETRIERQLIGCSSDQSQPVVIVPEDTVIQ